MAVAQYVAPRRWSVAEPTFAAEEIARRLGLSPLTGRCLVNRGIITPEAAEEFLSPQLKRLKDPFLLPDMDKAVEALLAERLHPVVIFGDYDVDGITATAILLETLTALGWKASSYLPHRIDDGYGLSLEAAEKALRDTGARLLIAVDCGSTAVDAIAALKGRGVEVIVLDHHQLCSPAPAACALVNPQRGEEGRELCSAGLAFKLAHALVKKLRDAEGTPFDIRVLLDLVALGTIADLVPLKGENRILVSAGLKRMDATTRPGLIALKDVAAIRDSVGVYEVGFQLAPRLNAAGRLEDAMISLDLLRATDRARAMELAEQLDATNRERQQLEQRIADECLSAVRAWFDPERHFAIVEGRPEWHVGVVGIVAARLQREFHRPAIVIGSDGSEWRGSGRSIAGFDIAAGLRECAHLLDRHGGHAMAAGVSLMPRNFEVFRERFNEVARARIDALSLQRPVRLDAEATLAELSLACVQELDRLGPFGNDNPPVQFILKNVRLAGEVRKMGAEQKHARFRVRDASGEGDVIWWNAGEVPDGAFDLAVAPQLNTYNGATRVQLKLQDFRPAAL